VRHLVDAHGGRAGGPGARGARPARRRQRPRGRAGSVVHALALLSLNLSLFFNIFLVVLLGLLVYITGLIEISVLAVP
jgi:hypothetical protein